VLKAYTELLSTDDSLKDRSTEFLQKIIQVSYTLNSPQMASLSGFMDRLLEVKVVGDLEGEDYLQQPRTDVTADVSLNERDQDLVPGEVVVPKEQPVDASSQQDTAAGGTPVRPPKSTREVLKFLNTTTSQEEKYAMQALVHHGLLVDKSPREVKQLLNHFTLAKCILTAVSSELARDCLVHIVGCLQLR
jgi:hypothetical protein